MDTLMSEIRALGHIPRWAGRAEKAVSQRLKYAKRNNLLSASQLAELAQMPRTEPRDASQLASERMEILMAEIRALGHIPRHTRGLGHEYALGSDLRNAKVRGLLSESQLAELAELARSSDEPLRKRLRVVDD